MQRLQHLLDAGRAGTGLEQRGAQFAFALNQHLAALAQVQGIEAIHGVELLARHPARQRQQHLRTHGRTGHRQAAGRIGTRQRLLVALAPGQAHGAARRILKAPCQ